LKFDLLEKFIEQKQAIQKVAEEMNRKIAQADEEYNSLKAKYESTLKEGVAKGKDVSKELDEISEKIEEAKKVCQRRREERDAYWALRPLEKIKSEDVVNAFNNDFIPKFRKQRFDEVLKNLLRAKYEYAKAVLAYYDALAEFEYVRNEARRQLGDSYYYKFNDIAIKTVDQKEHYFIRESDLYYFDSGQLPQSLKYVKEEDLK
jgi:cell fate (sporulation/competence/biofilm development) regulator YlbF (YheA/YmcA/DUF963 family)